MIKGPVLKRSRPVHAEIAALVDAAACTVVDPAEPVAARAVVIHHPTVFAHLPARRLAVAAGAVVLVLQHPERDAAGALQYDLPAIVANIRLVFGRPVHLAPVGPVARASLRQPPPPGSSVMEHDWHHAIDLSDWPPRDDRPIERPVVIGRHSRPQLEKWPDRREDAEAVYPASGDVRVRMLGGDAVALARHYGPLPSTWDVVPFGAEVPSDFLRGLDFYVYYHGDAWLEAFGRGPLEAMATGLVTILPPAFEALFGDGAVYAEPQAVRSIIERFVAEPDAYAVQSARARALVAARFGLEAQARRFADLLRDAPPPDTRPPGRAPERIRVLLVTSNGVGLGHLTRMLAIAARLPAGIEPVFFTLSQAMKLVREQGYLAEFSPFHRALGAEPDRWNPIFAEELHEALSFYRPRVVVFDGNVPYAGLTEALAAFPEVLSVWMRRAMWSPSNAWAMAPTTTFDAVIEPGEIAGAFDIGPTRKAAADVLRVDPILQHDPQSRLARSEARAVLGVPEGRLLVGVQLGSGNNYDFDRIRTAVLDALARRDAVEVVEFSSPVADVPPASTGPHHAVVEHYPSFRLSRGLDLAISAAGYNSFHEAIAGAIPTVFIPNEALEMDLQIVRASFAERTGCGRMLRARDVYAAAAVLGAALDPQAREAMSAACRRLGTPNGAADAARFVADLARFVRADRETMAGSL